MDDLEARAQEVVVELEALEERRFSFIIPPIATILVALQKTHAEATRAERERIAAWVEQWGGENSPACIAAAIRARTATQAEGE